MVPPFNMISKTVGHVLDERAKRGDYCAMVVKASMVATVGSRGSGGIRSWHGDGGVHPGLSGYSNPTIQQWRFMAVLGGGCPNIYMGIQGIFAKMYKSRRLRLALNETGNMLHNFRGQILEIKGLLLPAELLFLKETSKLSCSPCIFKKVCRVP